MFKKTILSLLGILTVSSVVALGATNYASSYALFTSSGQHGGQVDLERANHRILAKSYTGTTSYTIDMKQKKNNAWDPQILSVSGNGIGSQYSRYKTTDPGTYYLEAAQITGASNKQVGSNITH